MNKRKVISIVVMVIGVFFVTVGWSLTTPGLLLTTYESLDGVDGYSTIVEYINGDAYNYIIGASLVAGRYAGALVARAIYIMVGTLIFCIGLIDFAKQPSSKAAKSKKTEPVESAGTASDEVTETPVIEAAKDTEGIETVVEAETEE